MKDSITLKNGETHNTANWLQRLRFSVIKLLAGKRVVILNAKFEILPAVRFPGSAIEPVIIHNAPGMLCAHNVFSFDASQLQLYITSKE